MTAAEALGVIEVLAGEWEAGELARLAATGGADPTQDVGGDGEWVRTAVDEETQMRANALVASVMG
jgi:hypothetical protein